jgi:hypothetical protein
VITGLTHDKSGIANMTIKYRGKISTGYAPMEGPNKTNAPKAAGFFRMLKEVTRTERVGSSQKTVVIKDWTLNEEIQKVLEKSIDSKQPRRIEIVSLYQTPHEMWESKLAMYSGSEGLLCQSHGEGTDAKFLKFDPDGNRNWVLREFDGVPGCLYKKCPDYKEKKCKEIGFMKCFPEIDLTPNPYRLETKSINTIIGIESSITQLWNLLRVAHSIKEREAKKQLKFDGFFGARLYLIHKKIKSGGRDVFITDVMPTPDFISLVMEPIKRGLKFQVKQAALTGGGDGTSMLDIGDLGDKLLEINPDEDAVPLDQNDEKEIAEHFGADADQPEKEVTEGAQKDASKTMLDNKEN